MADGDVALQTLQGFLRENVGNETHVFVDVNLGAVRCYNSGALLTAMLQGIETEIIEFRGILVVENTAYSAFMGGATIP